MSCSIHEVSQVCLCGPGLCDIVPVPSGQLCCHRDALAARWRYGQVPLTWGCNDPGIGLMVVFIFYECFAQVLGAVECSAYSWNIKQLPPWPWYVYAIFHHLVCLIWTMFPPMRPVHGAMLCRIWMWSGLFSWYNRGSSGRFAPFGTYCFFFTWGFIFPGAHH